VSTALALAGVTTVLRDLLNDGLINHDVASIIGSTVMVSVMPPDRVVASNGTEASQLNLFLYKATPNPGWCNERLPSRDARGEMRLASPPLALDLHYLLSAFSASDLHAEILLGFGMQLLHENPVLSRQAIRTALTPAPSVGSTLPLALRALDKTGLADQVEQLRITPVTLDTEELSKLWTAFQVHYRPTTAYTVSVVLIESMATGVSALPVLRRGLTVQPDLVPPVPTIESVEPDGEQSVARLGHDVDLNGHHLGGTGRQVRLIQERFGIEEVLAAVGGSTPAQMTFSVPTSRAADFPVGIYQAAAELIPPGEADSRRTNSMALVIAPQIADLPMDVTVDAAGTAAFTVEFTPEYRPGQTVSMVLGSTEFAPQDASAQTSSLDFVIPNAPLGDHLARLRIDGIESPLIDREAIPPAFFDHRIHIS
jgi:Pvc16 N-terminal domain